MSSRRDKREGLRSVKELKIARCHVLIFLRILADILCPGKCQGQGDSCADALCVGAEFLEKDSA